MKWPVSILATFLIGLTAGVAPFIFMWLLPAMLNPDASVVGPNYLAIVLTGVLVGAITSIVFAKDFHATAPREVFVYALGVPAVLIATTTNITAESKASRRIAEVREQASGAVLLPPSEPATTDQQPQRLMPAPGDSLPAGARVRVTTATYGNGSGELQAGASFYVIIGEYSNSTQAWDDYGKYQKTQLRTERYASKDLGVYQLRPGAYILAYARYKAELDARRTYQLLRINDPQISVKILRSAR
jgi:hypothetical protein